MTSPARAFTPMKVGRLDGEIRWVQDAPPERSFVDLRGNVLFSPLETVVPEPVPQTSCHEDEDGSFWMIIHAC
jgi:hypothetical protein